MTPRQWKVTAVVSIAMAIIVAAVVVVVASSGDDGEEAISTDGTTTSSSTTQPTLSTTTTLPPILPPVTAPPATITPGSTVIVPTVPPPTQPPTTQPPTTQPSPTSTTEPDGGDSDVGITPTEIHLAVIADDPRAFEGMTAWMNQVNKGGIAGRKVRLDLLPTNGTAEGYADAVSTACEQDFAIVGSFSVFDATTESAGCGAIPDLPVEAVAPARQVAAYAAFPRRPATVATGAFAWIAGNVPGCCAQYWLVPTEEPARERTFFDVDGAAKIGYDTIGTVDVAATDPESRYDEIAEEIAGSDATFVASGLGAQSTVLLRRATTAADAAEGRTFFCNSACYDSAFLSDGGDDVEGELVGIETVPFSDRTDVAALKSYFKGVTKDGSDPSYEGLRAFVAGLLFERAAEQLVDEDGENGLTRVRLLEVLGGIHDFTAGGIVGTTDVGAREPTGCSVLLEVTNGKFVRKNPADKGQLDCGPQNLTEIGD